MGKDISTGVFDRKVDMKKFVILTNPRTGSELVCKLLDAHPSVNCYSEVFSMGEQGNEWNNSYYKVTNRAFAYLENIFKKEQKEICGYKQLSFWMNNAGFSSCREFVCESIAQGYVFIFLERTDLFKAYVSYMIMCIYQYGHLNASDEAPAVIHKIFLDPEETYINIRGWHGFNIYTKQILQEYKARHIVLNYEEDFADIALLRNKLFSFLGVDNIPIEAPLKVTNPFRTEELVENYTEILEYFNRRNLFIK